MGKVTHRATFKGSVASASLLKTQNQEILREKEANKTTLLDLPGSRGPSASPSRPSPGLATAKPKRLPLSANKPLSAMSIHSAPLRALHLLALAPISPQSMSQKTKIPLPDVENLLKEYGSRTADGLYTLADNRYKDLRVWEWKYSPSQRSQVIADSIKVFDSLKIASDHVFRRNLIDPKIKKAEAEAIAAEKEAKRRALAENEAAEKAAAEKAAFERAAEMAKARQSASVAARRGGVANGSVPVSSPNGYASSTSMLQKVTKIGSSNKKQRSASSSSNSSTETPKVTSSSRLQSASPQVKRANESDDNSGYSSPSAPITSSSRGRLKASANSRTKSTSPNPTSQLGKPSPTVSPMLSAVGSTNVTKKRKLPTSSSRPTTPTATSTNGVSIRTAKRAAIGTGASPVPVPSPSPANNKLPSPPRPPRAGPDEDMFALAEMFREKYTVYEKLYRYVSNSSDDRRRVRKLISLHRELESVKKKLWAMSPPNVPRSTHSRKQATPTPSAATAPEMKNSSRLR